jgi:hypothetical protein
MTLQQMINQAEAEAAASWAFARLSARPTKWATRQEAENNNPGYSFSCFAQGADGFWRLAA